MGWSCTAEADRVMEQINNLHDVNGIYTHKGKKYFIEWSEKEHIDGSISARVMKLVGNGLCKCTGYFKILPDGRLDRNPIGLRDKLRG